MTARTYLVRGLLAGLIAGVLAFGVAYLVGEGPVDAAIALEESATPADAGHSHEETAPAHSHGDDEEAVSRATQSTWGLATGTLVFGVAVGGILGLAAAFGQGRIGGLRPRGTVTTLAAIGFVAVFAVPFAKYPANPPAVGRGETIGTRTADYLLLMGISVVAVVLALALHRRLADRLGNYPATLISAVGYLVVVAVTMVLLPSVNEVPAGFPADVLWQFRFATVLVQTVIWATLGAALGAMVGRRSADRRPATAVIA